MDVIFGTTSSSYAYAGTCVILSYRPPHQAGDSRLSKTEAWTGEEMFDSPIATLFQVEIENGRGEIYRVLELLFLNSTTVYTESYYARQDTSRDRRPDNVHLDFRSGGMKSEFKSLAASETEFSITSLVRQRHSSASIRKWRTFGGCARSAFHRRAPALFPMHQPLKRK